MTSPDDKLTLDRCAAAIAEVLRRHGIPEGYSHITCTVIDLEKEGAVKFTGTRAECQAWIDRESARACIGALLPVSDGVVLAMRNAVPQDDLTTIESRLYSLAENEFTAALMAILDSKA